MELLLNRLEAATSFVSEGIPKRPLRPVSFVALQTNRPQEDEAVADRGTPKGVRGNSAVSAQNEDASGQLLTNREKTLFTVCIERMVHSRPWAEGLGSSKRLHSTRRVVCATPDPTL